MRSNIYNSSIVITITCSTYKLSTNPGVHHMCLASGRSSNPYCSITKCNITHEPSVRGMALAGSYIDEAHRLVTLATKRLIRARTSRSSKWLWSASSTQWRVDSMALLRRAHKTYFSIVSILWEQWITKQIHIDIFFTVNFVIFNVPLNTLFQ